MTCILLKEVTPLREICLSRGQAAVNKPSSLALRRPLASSKALGQRAHDGLPVGSPPSLLCTSFSLESDGFWSCLVGGWKHSPEVRRSGQRGSPREWALPEGQRLRLHELRGRLGPRCPPCSVWLPPPPARTCLFRPCLSSVRSDFIFASLLCDKGCPVIFICILQD